MGVILITGCSSGFGLLSAARLAASGHTVYATMRDLGKKDNLLTQVERRGGRVRLVRLDVTDDATIKTAIKQVESEVGRLNVLINNAGYGIAGFFEDLTEQEIRDQMETNFFGVQKVTRYALPLLRRTAPGGHEDIRSKIINVSSVQGRSPIPGLGAYATSKFALEGFSESLYHELRPFGIHVVVVEPGAYRTKIVVENGKIAEHSADPDSPYAPYTKLFQDRIRSALRASGTALGGDAEDVAALIEKIVHQPRPRFRYLIGGKARLRVLARAVLPFSVFSALVHRSLFGKIPPGV